MRNVDRLAQHITKNGAENILVHTVPGTSNWLICQKIDNDKWIITLASPMGNVTYNLGQVSDAQHLELWGRLIKQELETKSSQIAMAKDLKERIYNFKKQYENTYKRFNQPKTKCNGTKLCKRSKRSKKATR